MDNVSERYAKFAYKYFGNFSEKYLMKSFKDIRSDLQKADINLTAVEYISMAISTSIIVFIFMVPLLSVIVTILLNVSGNAMSSAAILGIFCGLLGGALTSTGIFMLFYTYPSVHP